MCTERLLYCWGEHAPERVKLKEEKLVLHFACLLLYETTYVSATRMLICIVEKACIHASSLWHACGCLLNRRRGF